MPNLKGWVNAISKLFVVEQGLIATAATASGIILGYGGLPVLSKFILPIIVSCMITYGLNSYNAVSDTRIDAINKPYRPIQQDFLSKKEALIIVVSLYAISLYLAYRIGSFFFYAILLAVVLGLLYSTPKIYLKKRFLIGNLTLCVIYAFIMPVAGFAYVSNIEKMPWSLPILAVFLAFPCSMLKDFEDYKGDKKFRINTMPVFFGVKAAKRVGALFIVLPYALVLLLVMAGWLTQKFLIFSSLGIFAILLAFRLLKIKKIER